MDTQRAVLFDIDGTLVDSTYHHAIAWQRAFDGIGMPVPLWLIHRSVGMGGDRLVGEVAGERTEQRHGSQLRTAWRAEYLRLRGEVHPLPGATDLVRSLRDQGFQVALASSGDAEFAREAVATLGIRKDVSVLVTVEDVEASKPAPDLVGEALRRLRDVETAVFVGDTPYDVIAAERAGIGCLAVRSGGYGSAELHDAGAAAVVEGPSDLLDLDWSPHLRRPDA